MEVNKDTIEAVLILLYKIDEHEACEAMLKIYQKYFAPDESKPQQVKNKMIHKQHLH